MTAFFTDFADQAVVLPLALVVALVLAWSCWWRGLIAWLLAVGAVSGTILVLKIVFAACAAILGATGVDSPSGHTASACIVYGGVLLLLLRGRAPTPVLVAAAGAIAALVGASRLALHVHTPGDVVVGTLVGMAGIAALAALTGSASLRHRRGLILASLLVIAAQHGTHLRAEAAIHGFALAPWLPAPAACRVQ